MALRRLQKGQWIREIIVDYQRTRHVLARVLRMHFFVSKLPDPKRKKIVDNFKKMN